MQKAARWMEHCGDGPTWVSNGPSPVKWLSVDSTLKWTAAEVFQKSQMRLSVENTFLSYDAGPHLLL